MTQEQIQQLFFEAYQSGVGMDNRDLTKDFYKIETHTNQRVIEELEFQAKDLAENDSVDDAIADINRRIKELKQTI
jgi:hypothetical protein|tara:strand:+ start:4025 stop:4252 length:228 start_codon:yes stop_codon:yes gene_type:complete